MADIAHFLFSDIVLEVFRAAVLLVLVVFLLALGARKSFVITKGWRFVEIGFLLVLLGAVVDVTDNFEALNRFVIIGDTEAQAFIEKVVGYLLGFSFLTVGLVLWAPTVETLMIEVSNRKLMEDKNALLLEAVTDGIVGCDPHGIITFANPAARSLLGYKNDEIIGQPIHERMQQTYPDGSYYPFSKNAVFSTISNGKRMDIKDEVFWRKDGSSFIAEYTSSPIWVDGKVNSAVITFRDISKRREVEKAKSEFVSTVSHELRTPLTSIKGALGLVIAGVSGQIPEKAGSVLTIAKKNCDRLELLVSDLLDFDKLRSGKMEFDMKPTDTSLLVKNSVTANKAYAQKHGVSIRIIENADHPVMVDGNIYRLMQVMDNLLSNAAKFSNFGQTIEVSLEQHHSSVRISVKDDGVGIPFASQARIFEKFVQADSSDTRAQGGTGLGLSIAKSIVEHHGGTLEFVSEPHKGSTFTFEIPTTDIQPHIMKLVNATAGQSELASTIH